MRLPLLTSATSAAAPSPPSRAVRAEGARRGGGRAARRARLRRVLSALLAALAVLGLGRLVVDRPPAGGVPVVVATTEVAAGENADSANAAMPAIAAMTVSFLSMMPPSGRSCAT